MASMSQAGHPALVISRETPIFTVDSKKLGTVKDVRGDYFKVNARWARDYWLSADEVLSADESEVRLVIPHDELNLYRMSKPGAGASLPGLGGDDTRPRFDDQPALRR